MGRRNLKEGVENYVDRTEKPRRRDGERCGWGRETLKKGWRTMWMERRNLEEGVENDVDLTEKTSFFVVRGGGADMRITTIIAHL